MKIKTISSTIAKIVFLVSFIYAGAVSPILSLRFNDVAGSTDLQSPGQCIGLRMQVGEGVYSGFDTDGTDFRIFIQQSFGTFGIGTVQNVSGANEPQFTIGGQYPVLENLNVSLDYVINRLTDADGDGAETEPLDDQLRISLGITF